MMRITEQTAVTFGVKGKAAVAWLAAQGLTLPAQPNSWTALPDESRILRLGRGEYLVEGAAASTLQATWPGGQPDLNLVPRYDTGFVLSGDATAVLAEICALDTRPQVVGQGVLMTLVAGISATLICDGENYRLWCDATYGEYMQQMLQEVMESA
jgi:sarcosine oxidase, subunit gamma